MTREQLIQLICWFVDNMLLNSCVDNIYKLPYNFIVFDNIRKFWKPRLDFY